VRPRKVTILYDAEEDRWFEETRAKGESADPPVHVPLGEALEKRGHRVRKIKAENDVLALAQALAEDKGDVVFNVCDGLGGVTARATQVAGLLELLGKRFTGASSEAMCLCQDKSLTKQLFTHHQIPTPRFAVLDRGHLDWADQLDFPLIVKPADEDASVGIDDSSVVRDVKSLLERVAFIHAEIGRPAIIEEYVEGREIYAVVFGNPAPEVLPLLEWPLSPGPTGARVATYGAKWDPLHPDYQEAADTFARDLPAEVVERIEEGAIRAYRALKLRDYARLDVRLAENGQPYFIEVNPNPFLDPTAEVSMAAQARGLDYGDLAEWIISLALERYRAPRRRPPSPAAVAAAAAAARKGSRSSRATKKRKKEAASAAAGLAPAPAAAGPSTNGNGDGGRPGGASHHPSPAPEEGRTATGDAPPAVAPAGAPRAADPKS
jgi:D-alanine-D-alanine ligase